MDKSDIRIAVIIPYTGKWPSYLNLFLKGCEKNPWLDVLFFTDCQAPTIHPPNVYFHKMSLKDISNLTSDELATKIDLHYGYKLCDLRPLFAKIFNSYIVGYDYWGYGDIDLIYGNLKPFIFQRIEQGYDILSSRHELLSGSFSLLRNSEYIAGLHKRIPNYASLLQNPSHQCIDETFHDNRVWNGGEKLDLPDASFTKIVAIENEKNNLKASFETICNEHIGKRETIRYNNGSLKFQGEEVAYFHYVTNKGRPGFIIPKWKKIPQQFVITQTGFYTLTQLKYFVLINNYRLITGHFFSIVKRAKNKLSRVIATSLAAKPGS